MASTISRPSGNYAPSIWGSTFSSFPFPSSVMESYERRGESMKIEVKGLLMASSGDPLKNIEFIDLVCRLGVSYHFEKEIDEQLNTVYSNLSNILENNSLDLFRASLLFRVLRQHGYKMSCDAFNKFKSNDGKFKQDIADDVRGILSLCEASYLGFHGEHIMEEALSFAIENLEYSLNLPLSAHLAKHIKTALILPFHKSLSRIEARQYITFYQEEEDRKEALLNFAKLDFNRVQLLHQQELASLSRWWDKINLREKLPYARDRLVEVYLWSVGCYFEPEYAVSRMLLSKVVAMISLLDDTFDIYGTLEELQLFVETLARWDIAAIDQLPDYMKILYKTILSVINEVEDVARERGEACGGSYLKEGLMKLVRGYYQEAKWARENYVPPIEEYSENGRETSTNGVFMPASFIAMKAIGIKEFEWQRNDPKIVRGLKIVGRIKNDLVTRGDEQARGDCASIVECYVKTYGVSESLAIQEVNKMCEDAWKNLNEELCLKENSVALPCLKVVLNLMRTTETFYRHVDGYTKSAILKDSIISLFVEKIEI